eukprot:2580885-Pyramimonas_sp.AAC.1
MTYPERLTERTCAWKNPATQANLKTLRRGMDTHSCKALQVQGDQNPHARAGPRPTIGGAMPPA